MNLLDQKHCFLCQKSRGFDSVFELALVTYYVHFSIVEIIPILYYILWFVVVLLQH